MDEYLKSGTSYDRLYREYKKHGTLTIGFDFDGTVHDFHKKGETYTMVINLLRELKALNCRLICWTCFKAHQYVIEYLTANDIPFDGVNIDGIPLPWDTRKPFFNALLDDRAGLMQTYNDLSSLVLTIKQENHDREISKGLQQPS